MQIFPEGSQFYLMPEHIRAAVIKYVFDMGAAGDISKMDLGSPILRPVFRQNAPFFFTLFLFSVLASCGLAGSGSLLWAANASVSGRRRCRRRLPDPADSDSAFAPFARLMLLNVAAVSLLQLLLVLPASLFVLLVHNWVLGSFLCHTLPMIQDIPNNCLLLTVLALASEHRRHLRTTFVTPTPTAKEVNGGHVVVGKAEYSPLISPRLALMAIWITSVAAVLPYASYISYTDLSVLGKTWAGGAICSVNISSSAAAYVKGLVIVLYASPLLLTFFLWGSSSRMLKRERKRRLRRMRRRQRRRRQQQQQGGGGSESDGTTQDRRYSRTASVENMISNGGDTTDEDDDYGDDVDNGGSVCMSYEEEDRIRREKRAIKFTFLLAMVYLVCLLPLNILKLLRRQIYEMLQDEDMFDLTYLTVAWFSFLPTLLAPFVVSHWLRVGWLADQCLSLFLAESLGIINDRDLDEDFEEDMLHSNNGGRVGEIPSAQYSMRADAVAEFNRKRSLSLVPPSEAHYQQIGPQQHNQIQQHQQLQGDQQMEDYRYPKYHNKRTQVKSSSKKQHRKASQQQQHQHQINLKEIECFNSHSGGGGQQQRQDHHGSKKRRASNSLKACHQLSAPDDMQEPRRQSYCPGYHTNGRSQNHCSNKQAVNRRSSAGGPLVLQQQQQQQQQQLQQMTVSHGGVTVAYAETGIV